MSQFEAREKTLEINDENERWDIISPQTVFFSIFALAARQALGGARCPPPRGQRAPWKGQRA